jgi:hypothetical protein
MRVIRGRRGKSRARGHKLAAWLALFSLLVQLWITAGHFHPEDFATFARPANAGPVLATPADHGTQPVRALLHEDCALCLSVQVAGSAALTSATLLSEPETLGAGILDDIAALPRSPPAHFLFQTRAPPIV